MGFWGVEVKPDKAYSHRFDDATRGRLHVSQATLGNGTSTNKCSLQCTLLGKAPVLLCSLLPDHSESCSLNLEFDPDHDNHFMFSVLGPRSIHISGYSLLSKSSAPIQDDSESFGEDIENSDTSSDLDADDDDNYEDDFIDDRDLDALSASPSPSPAKARRKRLKKQYQVSDSDGGVKKDEKKAAIIGGGRSIFSSDSEDEVIGAKRKLPYFEEDESESDVDRTKKKKKKEKKDEKLDTKDNRGNEIEKAVKSSVAGEEIVAKTEKIRKVDEEVEEEDNKERKKKKKKKIEIESAAITNNRNVDEEVVEEDGCDRKKKKKNISSPIGQ